MGNIECIVSNMDKISIVLTLFIAFNTYLFNYEAKAHFGSLEINVKTNDKIVPIINGVLFLIYILVSMLIVHNIEDNGFKINDIIKKHTLWYYCAIFMITIILYYIWFKQENKLKLCLEENLNNKSSKEIIIKFLLFEITIGVFLGILSGYWVELDFSDKYERYEIILNIVIYILIYFLILKIASIAFYKSIVVDLKLYKFNLIDDKSIEGYLIGVFNGLLKIKDSNNNIRFINKDQIKEIREIGTVGVEDNEKFKGAKWKI